MGLQPSPRWQTSLKDWELPTGQPRADIPGVLTVAFATLWGSPHLFKVCFLTCFVIRSCFLYLPPPFTLSSAPKRVRVEVSSGVEGDAL